MDKIEQLTQLFMRLDAGESPEQLRNEAKDFLSTVGPGDIAIAEKSLSQSANGRNLRVRCSRHITLLSDQVAKLRATLPLDHIVRTILVEHEMMLCFLADLEDLNSEIQQMSYCSPTSFEMRKLAHIVSHLIVAGDHQHREDEIIFPELERHGYYGPPEILKLDNIGLDACKREIADLVHSASKKIDFIKFKLRFDAAVKYLVPAFKQQILTEDNILYPIALEVIKTKAEWDRIKAMCEQIGYCGFDARW